MESKNELTEINVKNCAYYYFDDIINGMGINFIDILLDKNLYENISVNDISQKNSAGPKPSRIKSDKIDEFTIVLDGKIKRLVLFVYGLFDKICNKIKYLTSKKVVLQTVLMTILEGSKLIYIILYLLKKYWLFTML